ncbi:MAG: hypothetical protein WA814_08850 [Candidatus Baltobacteraceae bacterium]
MKINLLTIGGLAVALAMPLGVCAQQTQQAPPAQAQARTTPSEAKIQHRWQKRLGSLNLSGQQQQQIQSLIDQYSRSHPEGSPRDRDAAHALRQQIMGVLTSDQQGQLRAQMQARHQQMEARHSQQQQQQQAPQGQPPNQEQPDQQQPPPGAPPA